MPNTHEQFIEEALEELEYQIKERFTASTGHAMRDLLQEAKNLLHRHREFIEKEVREETKDILIKLHKQAVVAKETVTALQTEQWIDDISNK